MRIKVPGGASWGGGPVERLEKNGLAGKQVLTDSNLIGVPELEVGMSRGRTRHKKTSKITPPKKTDHAISSFSTPNSGWQALHGSKNTCLFSVLTSYFGGVSCRKKSGPKTVSNVEKLSFKHRRIFELAYPQKKT